MFAYIRCEHKMYAINPATVKYLATSLPLSKETENVPATTIWFVDGTHLNVFGRMEDVARKLKIAEG